MFCGEPTSSLDSLLGAKVHPCLPLALCWGHLEMESTHGWILSVQLKAEKKSLKVDRIKLMVNCNGLILQTVAFFIFFTN